jgi:tetratricopeptide (TPR) repeat protein
MTGRSAKTLAAAVLMISIAAAAISSAFFRPPNPPREGRIFGAAAGEAIPPSSRSAIEQAPGRPRLDELERLIRAFSAQTDETPNATGLAFLGRLELERARLTGDIGSFTRAERALDDAHGLAPRDAEVGTLLATVRFTTHDFTGALDLADAVYSAGRDPGALAVRADAQLELGRYAAAAADYRTLSSLLPGSAGVQARAARLAFLQGRQADADRLAAAAESAARREGAFGATLAWYGSLRGRMALDGGRYDEAARHYRRAVLLAPDYHVAIGGLAAVRSAQDRYDEAIELYERASRLVPEPQYLASLGDLYMLTGRDDLAETRYGTVKVIATLARANRQLYDRQLALFYADHDLRPDDALAIAQQSLETRTDVYGYDALAWALYRLERHDEARAASTRALALGTQDARLWYHAGMISIGLGHDDLAVAQLTRALRLSPSFDPVQSAVARDALAELEAGR